MTRECLCYSDYKSCNTLKYLFGVEPSGGHLFQCLLAFQSLTKNSHYRLVSETLKHLKCFGKLEKGDRLMVDKGVRIAKEVDSLVSS